MSNSNLRVASKTKNDEFYTQFNDIEAELTAYYEYNHEVLGTRLFCVLVMIQNGQTSCVSLQQILKSMVSKL